MVFCLKLYFGEWKLVEFSLLVGKEEEMVGEDGSIAINRMEPFATGDILLPLAKLKITRFLHSIFSLDSLPNPQT
jgi:hypothetical protein